MQWNHQADSHVFRLHPVIIGHGGSGRPSTDPNATPINSLIGNTRKAIQTAIAANVDWIEIDIRVSKDGKIVVFHDPEIDAKTTDKGAVGAKSWQDLQSYSVLVNGPEKILSLNEVFAELHTDKLNWVLDIKAEGISDDVIKMVEEAGIPNEHVIIFGDHHVLRSYKGKEYRLADTTMYENHKHMYGSPSDVFRRCKDNSYDLLVVPVVLATPNLVTRAQEGNIEVWCYDSNDPRDLKYCAECGVRGLIVDDSKAAMSQFHDRGETH